MKFDRFRWNEWNVAKVEKHGVTVGEAEYVVRNARRPYPRRIGDEKWQVVGRGHGDRFLQVIYVIDADGTLFIIHAMPLSTRRRRGG
jgi:uncharacterized DUF497 family protein